MLESISSALAGISLVQLAIIACMALFASVVGGVSGYEVNAKVAKADGLAVGTEVRLAGVKVGTVSDLTLDPKTYLVTVHMNIRDDVKLPVDSSVLVTQAGFLGGQYLSITPGGDDKMMVAGAYFENAQGSIDVMGLVGRFANGDSLTNQAPKPKPSAPQTPNQGPVKAPDPGAGP